MVTVSREDDKQWPLVDVSIFSWCLVLYKTPFLDSKHPGLPRLLGLPTDFLYDLLSMFNLCDSREKHPAGLGSAGGFGVTR